MIQPRAWAATVLAAVVTGVAGCGPAAPPTPGSPQGSPELSMGTSQGPATSSNPSATQPTPSPTSEGGSLGLRIGALDSAWTVPLLEFASDGEAVIFSSGVADGTDSVSAPDLWRYRPGMDQPELLWANPNRDRQLVRIAGDLGTWAFVEIGVEGERAWDLYLLTGPGETPIHLDTHPGDEDVPSLVPSFTVHGGQIVWTAFDRGPNGPVSQMFHASGPTWEPRLLAERDADAAELWLPSLRGSLLAYGEVIYAADRSTDERQVHLVDLAERAFEPQRLDTSGLATMPLVVADGVIWKETDPGFSMFNWGRLRHFDAVSGETSHLTMAPQEYVNYPSAGSRFVAAWGADAFTFSIGDLELRESHLLGTYEPETNENVLRPHVSSDLLVWLHSAQDGLGNGPPGEIRYAFLPSAGSGRRGVD